MVIEHLHRPHGIVRDFVRIADSRADGVGAGPGGGNLRFITKRRHSWPSVTAMKERDQPWEHLQKRHSGLYRNFSQHMALPGKRH